MKVQKLFAILFLIFISQFLHSQQAADLFSSTSFLDEQFNDNSRKWITENKFISGKLENGHFSVICKNYKGSTGISYPQADFDYGKDFEIETSFTVLRGSGGLIFGMNDNFNHHRIEITEKRNIYFLKNDTKITEYLSVSESPLVKPGAPNKVLLRKTGNTYTLYINDSFVTNIDNIDLAGKMFGFNVGRDSEINVDYLKISYLERKAGNSVARVTPDEAAPPVTSDNMVLDWTSPSDEKVTLQEYTAWAKGKITTGSGIESVYFYVNGVSVGQSEFIPVPGETNTYRIEKLINLKPGENTVYFLVTDSRKTSQKSETRYFVNPETIPPDFIWNYPTGAKSIVNNEKIDVEATILTKTGLSAARLIVNGVSFDENPAALIPNSAGEIKLQREVILRDGENSIYIAATNPAGNKISEARTVIFDRALTEKRIALVIGNSDYLNNVTLRNPVNDANLMEATLKSLDFKVIKGINMGYSQMLDSLREFSRKLSEYNVALFYYAGHGIQVDGINYLIPVDAKLAEKNDCSWEALAVNKITDEFNKHSTNTNIVILDACRNNPYRSWARGEINGFKALSPVNGTIISFATSEGSTAADGSGLNGVFTEVLARQMMEPQQIENVFKNTRKLVKEKTKDQQVPMEWNYLTEDFYFVKP